MSHADNLSRALLALILVCLVILLLRGDGGSGSDAPTEAPEPTAVRTHGERYQFKTISRRRRAPLILRSDTATGQAWRMSVLGPGIWEALREGPEGVPSAGAEEPGRYEIEPVAQSRGAPTLVRSDLRTGRIWRKGSTNAGAWVLVRNPGEAPAPALAATASDDAGAESAAEVAAEAPEDADAAADAQADESAEDDSE